MENLVTSLAFWRGRRVLVTGHTGFKGGWLTLWLKKLGAQVSGFALAPPTDPSLFELAKVADGIESTLGDVRDAPAVADAVRRARPEVVFHLAAQPLVRAGYADPAGTYATNVMGAINLLEAVRSAGGVRAVVNVTSDKCYENREWPWGYRENEPLGGFDPYSSSKACAEMVTQSWRSAFFPPEQHAKHGTALATARAGNVIGGGDWGADRLIPDFVRAISNNTPLRIRSPDAVRPWQHVLDPLAGYLRLAELLYGHGPDFGEAWNFGPGAEDARPVRWVLDQIHRAWGDVGGWELDAHPQPHEASTLKLDCSKARGRLGWVPRLALPVALEWTVEWYKAWRAGADMTAVCMDQLNRYETLAAP